MTDVTPCNPHKEEDEGYLAAEAGRSLSENIYPVGTIRFEHWRRGWRIKKDDCVALAEARVYDLLGVFSDAHFKQVSESSFRARCPQAIERCR